MEFLETLLSLGQSTLEQGLITSLTVLALFLSYSMLNVCDLSTDGCYALGAIVGGMVAKGEFPLMSGVSPALLPFLSLLFAMLFGAMSGFLVSLLQTRMGINSLLAGIVVNTGLYSVNMAIMKGSPLVSIARNDTVFTLTKKLFKGTPLYDWSAVIVLALIVALVCVFLFFFLRTRLGLAIRATGDNDAMVKASSINPIMTTTVALCISNSFTALAGCLMAQFSKSADVNVGSGVVTIALASLLIGHTFFKKTGMGLRIFGMVVGALVFRTVYTVALRFNMPAYMLKAVSSLIVILAVFVPYITAKTAKRRHFSEERRSKNA